MPEYKLFARTVPVVKDEPSKTAVAVEQKQVRAAIDEELKHVNELAKDNPALKELAADLKALDMPEKQSQTPDDVRRDAIKQIDKVAEKIDEQQKVEEISRMLGGVDVTETAIDHARAMLAAANVSADAADTGRSKHAKKSSNR